MKIEYLREFAALAECGNFLSTAEDLYITQATLSRHIQSMEKELDTALFIRSTRNLKLTEVGALLLPYALQIIAIQDNYLAVIKQHNMHTNLVLNIGSIRAIEEYGITDIITKFLEKNPDIHINLSQERYEQLPDMVRHRRFDFAFIRETALQTERTGDSIGRRKITTDSIAAILPSSHPLSGEKIISLSQLKNENILLMPEGTFLYRLCHDTCVAVGFEPKIVFTSVRNTATIDLVANGMGVALLAKKSTKPLLRPDTVLIDISPSITAQINLIYNTDYLSIPAKRFLSFVHAYLRDIKL